MNSSILHRVKHFKITRFIFLALFSVALASPAIAETFPIDRFARFISWSSKDGLGADQVLNILEDRYGMMWFATKNGLTRFDGFHFTVYNHNPKDTTTLSDNKITSLAEDPEGNLWIGTFNGLNRMERGSGKFIRFYSSPDALPDNHIKALYADREGGLWLETNNNYLSRYDLKHGTWEHTSHLNPSVEGEYYYHHIVESNDGTLWMGGRAQGVCKVTDKSIQSIQYPIANPSIEYFEGSCFAESREGTFFASDDKGNFSRYNPKKNRFETILNIPMATTCAAVDARENIWIGGRNGLIRLDLEREKHIAFQHNPEDKHSIPSDNIYCLFSDSRGNVWIGTDRGVSLYSIRSNTIRSYRQVHTTGDLTSDEVTALLEDRDGLLWIGTKADGTDTLSLKTENIGNLKYELLKKDLNPAVAKREQEVLKQYRKHGISVPNDRINENNVSSLYQDSRGKIYIGLWSHVGFNVYDKKERIFKRHCLWSVRPGFIYPLLLEGNLFGANWYAGFLEDRQSNFWCATWEGMGLNQFDRDRGEFTGRHFIPGTVPRMPWAVIRSFIQDSSASKIYLGGAAYYGYYDVKKASWQRYAEILPDDYPNRDFINRYYRYCPVRLISLPANQSDLRVCAQSGDEIWLTSSDALLRHNTVTDRVEIMYRLKKMADYSFAAFSYNKSHLYICWDRHVLKFSLTDGKPDNLSTRVKNWNLIPESAQINALYEARSRDLVIITHAGEFILPSGTDKLIKKTFFNLPSNQYYFVQDGLGEEIYLGTAGGLYQTSLREPERTVPLLKSLSAYYLYQEKERLYACTGDGLYIIEKKSGAKEHFHSDPTQRYSLPHNTVYAITRINDSLMLVSTGNGVAWFNERTRCFTDVYEKVDNAVSSRLASCIREDSRGNLWYGTTEKGVNLISSATGKVKCFTHRPWDKTGIPDNYIADVFEDSRKNIWIGTRLGLCKYNPDDTFDRIIPFEGKEIRRILEDTSGYLWISTHSGLYRYDPAKGTIRVFYSRNGFLNDNYSGAACRLKDGRLAFGGDNGFNLFEPEILNEIFQPQINLTDFKIGEKLLYVDVPREISLSSREHSFSVNFCANDYESVGSIRYRYRLKGFEEEWNYTAPPLLTIKYSHVSGGRYVLEIEASNPFGEWSGHSSDFIIDIAVPFYKSGWFILLIICLTALLIRQYIKWREKKLKERNRILEETIAQRTSEIKKEIDSKNHFFSIISHDLKNPLHALKIVSGSLYDNYNKMTEEERLKTLDTIRSSSSNTAQLLDSLLLWVLSQMDMIHPHYVKTDLHTITGSVISLLDLLAQKKNIILENRTDPKLSIYTDENMFSTILRNLVGNAIKYSRPGGSVYITSEESEGKVYISVQDEGVGMSSQMKDKLFRIDTKIRTRGTAQEEGAGIGLIITSEFVRKLGETISVTSREGEGSRFVFSIKKN